MGILVVVVAALAFWLVLPGELLAQAPGLKKNDVEQGLIPQAGDEFTFDWCGKGAFDRALVRYYARVRESLGSPTGQIEGYDKLEVYEEPEVVCARLILIAYVRWVIMMMMGIIHLLGLGCFIWVVALYGIDGSSPQTVAFARVNLQNIFFGFVLVSGVWLFFEILMDVMFGMSIDMLGFFRLS